VDVSARGYSHYPRHGIDQIMTSVKSANVDVPLDKLVVLLLADP
jgi:hypothetical protein